MRRRAYPLLLALHCPRITDFEFTLIESPQGRTLKSEYLSLLSDQGSPLR